jgi:hypothetical protein
MVGTTLSSRVGWLNRLVGDWPVFLSSAMHHDLGDLFAVGDTRSWDVELIDGQAAGWPEQVLAAVMVTIGAAPSFAHRGAIADAGDLRACWQGPEPPGSTLALRAGLVADVWNPPFRAQVSGLVHRIRTVAYGRVDREGVLVPAGPWVLEDVQRTPRWLRTAQHADPLDAICEDGLLITLAVSSSAILPWNHSGGQ